MHPKKDSRRHILRIRSQKRRKPLRCQATTVSGRTMASAERLPLQMRDGQTHNRRSTRVNFGRFLYGSLKHADLVAQSQVLQLERSARIEDRRQICEECREGNEHQREL